MKTKFFVGLMFFLFAAFSSAYAVPPNGLDDVKLVVSSKKIWVIAGETPVENLCIKVRNAEGKVVLEKTLSSKTTDWWLNVEELPKGDYTVDAGKGEKVKFHR